MTARMRVLVADDDKLISAILQATLEKNGFEVASAHDGQEALHLLSSFRPDAVLLDVMMPGENGYRVSRTIKTLGQNAQGFKTPKVLLLTARRLDDPEREEIFRKFSMADDVMYKPLDPVALLAKLRALIGPN